MAIVKVCDSIKNIDAKKWNACFNNTVEDYNYLLALELSNIEGFTHLYYVVEEDGEIVAACPAFITFYGFKTMADGFLKKLLPNWLGLKLLCLSSCFSENCLLGFKPGLTNVKQQELLILLLNFFKQDAKNRGINFLGIRDLIAVDYSKFKITLEQQDFTACGSFPSAFLLIKWSSLDDYLAKACSKVTRKEIKRKLKASTSVVIERRNNIDDIINDLYTLYEDTENRSEWHFGKLTKEYFILLLKYSPKIFCNLYFINGKLLAANLLLENKDLLLDKFFCMSYEYGREYNLYTLSWVHNLSYAINNNIKLYQAGQTGYAIKRRLGCSFANNYIAFWHRNKIVNFILKLLAPKLVTFDLEKELKRTN